MDRTMGVVSDPEFSWPSGSRGDSAQEMSRHRGTMETPQEDIGAQVVTGPRVRT